MKKALKEFADNIVCALPTAGISQYGDGRTIPQYVLAEIGDHSYSLAAAFLNAISPEPNLIDNSIEAMKRYWDNMNACYGLSQKEYEMYTPTSANQRKGSIEELVNFICSAGE